MKLLNFRVNGRDFFGMAVEGFAVPFEVLQARREKPLPFLENIYSFIEQIPASFESARELEKSARTLIQGGDHEGIFALPSVKILPPVPRPAALLDFGLTPRHLINSSRTMLSRELNPLVCRIVLPFVKRRIVKMCRSGTPSYYKCNHLSVIGDEEEVGWPGYASYLDIEPELAVVMGSGQRIAGYTIFNDVSARDVQFPEMTGSGPARSKDFEHGNGLGPFLVTPDEVPDPLALKVTVKVGDRITWQGSTSEYTMPPEDLVQYCSSIFRPRAGTVIGMGTIPGCTGLDNDMWVRPGELVAISFARLGTLHQKIPERPAILEPSRWGPRDDLP